MDNIYNTVSLIIVKIDAKNAFNNIHLNQLVA